MSVVDSQPSPFGHLTRERHIESVSRPPKKKQDFSEAVERSQGGAMLVASSRSTGLPRSQSGRVTRGGFARACGSGEHSCLTDAWTHSEAVPCGIRHQGPLNSPPRWSRCKGGLGPTQQPGEEEKQGSSYLGLQMLAGVRQLCITSTGELCGAPGSLARKGYVVSTADHERGLLVVTEEYSRHCFHLCGPARSCHLCLQDWEGQVILWFYRPFRMGLGCFGCCCPVELRAFTSDNRLVGIVHQRCSIFSHLLEVCDARGSAIMKIHGCGATCRCFTKQEFQVLSSSGHVVAVIWKKWPGFREERNMDHEFFGVDMVSADLSNEERACLLAAAFLLNFMFFEVS